MFHYNRVYKSINQNIRLVYYYQQKHIYNFFVLGTSNFIYLVTIDKNYQTCNCEDFVNGNYCKHINFILFKLLKIFKLLKNNQLKFIFKNSLRPSSFLETYCFDELEWYQIKIKYKKIHFFLRKNNFNEEYFYKFKKIITKYYLFFKPIKTLDNCKICLQEGNDMLSCPRCKNVYHLECIYKWFRLKDNQNKCPICSDNSWETLMCNILIKKKQKIPLDKLINYENL